MKRHALRWLVFGLIMGGVGGIVPASSSLAKASKSEMLERYERAAHLMRGAISRHLTFNDRLYPYWIGDSNSFWYLREVKNGDSFYHEIRLVDADKRNNNRAFDHKKFAKAVSEISSKKWHYKNVSFGNSQDTPAPFRHLEITLNPMKITFLHEGKKWQYDPLSGQIKTIAKLPWRYRASPDGTQAIFHKDHNVWLRDLTSGKERPLTTDGEEHNYYMPDTMHFYDHRVEANWSPDGKYILTYKVDSRKVKNKWAISWGANEEGLVEPSAQKIKLADYGDEHIGSVQYVVIEAATGKVVTAKYRDNMPGAYIPTRSFLHEQAWWGKDSRLAYFVDLDRYHKTVRVVEFDIKTAQTRVLLEETSDTRFRLRQEGEDSPVMMALPETDELLWYSDRSGWAHLYLYDLKTGKLKNRVTEGQYLVSHLVRFDKNRREVFLQTMGRDRKGKDHPFYRDLVRVNIDSGKMVPLASSNHDIDAFSPDSIWTYEQGGFLTNGISPTGDYAVVIRSRTNTVPYSSLLDRNGKNLMTLENADISRLPEDWNWPEPVKATAADGKTAIFGVIYRPSNFDLKKSYPVINYVDPSSQYLSVPKSAFNFHGMGSLRYYPAQAIAELGFIVVQFDGRGTPNRSKAFGDHNYGWLEGASDLDDHVAGIKELSHQYSYMDMDRIGIVGMTHPALGMMDYPDFYKVGVQGLYWDARYLPSVYAHSIIGRSAEHLEGKYVTDKVDKLRGKLMLSLSTKDKYGTLPGTFYLFGELTKANKNFDIAVHAGDNWIYNNYMVRQGWDYLVEHLLNDEPPKDFQFNGTTWWDEGYMIGEINKMLAEEAAM